MNKPISSRRRAHISAYTPIHVVHVLDEASARYRMSFSEVVNRILGRATQAGLPTDRDVFVRRFPPIPMTSTTQTHLL